MSTTRIFGRRAGPGEGTDSGKAACRVSPPSGATVPALSAEGGVSDTAPTSDRLTGIFVSMEGFCLSGMRIRERSADPSRAVRTLRPQTWAERCGLDAAPRRWDFLYSNAPAPNRDAPWPRRVSLPSNRSVSVVLLRLIAGQTDVEALLPDRWAANPPEHVLQHCLDESRQKARRERRRAVGRRSSGS